MTVTINSCDFGTGTSGQILTSNGPGVSPTFQAASTGNVTGPGASTDRAIATWNGVGGTALFNNSTTKIDATGRFTNTAQPAFMAYVTATLTNKTGDSTLFPVPFNSVSSPGFDIGSNFNIVTGVFTAPVSGIYYLSSTILINNIGVGHNGGLIDIITTSPATAQGALINPAACQFLNAGAVNTLSLTTGRIFQMAASQTAAVVIAVYSSTKTIGVFGDATGSSSWFCGYLIA